MSWEKEMQALADVFAEDHAKTLGIDRKYADWILANVEGDGYGQCKEVTRQMAEAFPELKRIRGHYYCWAWGERAHWWLADANGTIIDPTAQQFPSKGKGEYVPWPEGAPEPTGYVRIVAILATTGTTCCSERVQSLCGLLYEPELTRSESCKWKT